MFIITVIFQIKPAHVDAFRAAILKNAATSLHQEEGCLTFDVCEEKGSPVFFLYERYVDEAAFDLHLRAQHFIEFDKLVADWVESKRVGRYRQISE
jgi:quinol monooxygenase YgiN